MSPKPRHSRRRGVGVLRAPTQYHQNRARAALPWNTQLYGKRWSIETAFFEITTTLSCEINTLGYPKAALLAFCLALVAYNAVSRIKAALRSVHGRQKIHDEVSSYYLS